MDEYELNFWKKIAKNPKEKGLFFRHRKFYDFFNLGNLQGDILEVGCGGEPIDNIFNIYSRYQIDLVDPIIDSLLEIKEYKFLKRYSHYSVRAIDFKTDKKYDNIIMLNCLDHIESQEEQEKTIINLIDKLSVNGKFYIYYDLRDIPCEGHYPVCHETILKLFESDLEIEKSDLSINPKHKGWGNVRNSYRAIFKK